MAHKKRMNERIAVNLPVTCSLADKKHDHHAHGKVTDLSISGMQLELPLHFSKVKSKVIDFVLELPHPFSRIKGAGEVQWQRWNSGKQSVTCGLKLAPMSLRHLEELDMIVTEIKEDDRQDAKPSKTK
jgi:hypothetical protein